MFYLGMRSSYRYLGAIERVRQSEAPCDIVTVAGGTAFLHAISPATRSLTIVDRDPDTLAHWSLIRALIAEATSLADFLTLLSGHAASVPGGASPRAALGPRVDIRPRLAATLSSADLATYDRTYGALHIDAARGVGRSAQSTVRFTGTSLRQRHFNWQFGKGNLASDATFTRMRRQLAVLPVRLEQARFEELDFDRLFPEALGHRRVFLASNCESPLFTRGDAIFLRVLDTATRPVRYVSWYRDVLVVRDDTTPIEPDTHAIGARPIDPRGATLLVESRSAFLRLWPGNRWRRTAFSLENLLAVPTYGQRLLVVAGGTAQKLTACLTAVAPAFRHVIWVPAQKHVVDGAVIARPNYCAAKPIVFREKPAWWFQLRGLST